MVLETLFNESISPTQQAILSSSPEYVDTVETIHGLLNSLQKESNADIFERIKKLENCIQETKAIENRAFFSYGLALGLSIMKESSQVLESFSKTA